MYLLMLPQTDPISMKETGQTLIKLILYYFSNDWDDALKIKEENIDYSTEVLRRSAIYLIAMLPLKKSANIN